MSGPSPVAALIIQPDGTAEITYITPSLEALQEIVGGQPEAIHPPHAVFGDWHAYVDEERRSEAAQNLVAVEFARSVGWEAASVTVTRGPAIFLGMTPDGEEADVPPEVVGAAVRLWGLEE